MLLVCLPPRVSLLYTMCEFSVCVCVYMPGIFMTLFHHLYHALYLQAVEKLTEHRKENSRFESEIHVFFQNGQQQDPRRTPYLLL